MKQEESLQQFRTYGKYKVTLQKSEVGGAPWVTISIANPQTGLISDKTDSISYVNGLARETYISTHKYNFFSLYYPTRNI